MSGSASLSRYSLIDESIETHNHYGSNAVPQEIPLTIGE
jgi:hypothetical protein